MNTILEDLCLIIFGWVFGFLVGKYYKVAKENIFGKK